MSKNHIGVTTKLKKEVVDELESLAEERGTYRSALVREAVEDYLAASLHRELLTVTPQKQKFPAS